MSVVFVVYVYCWVETKNVHSIVQKGQHYEETQITFGNVKDGSSWRDIIHSALVWYMVCTLVVAMLLGASRRTIHQSSADNNDNLE